MIAPDASLIRHTSPYKRIDLGARPPRNESVVIDVDIDFGKINEQDRIWQLVRQAAGAGE